MTNIIDELWETAKMFLWFIVSFLLAVNHSTWIIGCLGLYMFVCLEGGGGRK